MAPQPCPTRMSLPEVMGDPCASELREHALAILRATASSHKLIRSHPEVKDALSQLSEDVERLTTTVLEKLADQAGIPSEGDSISPARASGRLQDRPLQRLLDLDAERYTWRVSDHRTQGQRKGKRPRADLLDARARSGGRGRDRRPFVQLPPLRQSGPRSRGRPSCARRSPYASGQRAGLGCRP